MDVVWRVCLGEMRRVRGHSLGERESTELLQNAWVRRSGKQPQQQIRKFWRFAGVRATHSRARSCEETCMRFRGCWHDDNLHFFSNLRKKPKISKFFCPHSAKIRTINKPRPDQFAFSVFRFWVVAKLAIIHKEILAKFGYKSGMKVEKFKNPFHILATCWNLL
jgi:hypothetical protein